MRFLIVISFSLICLLAKAQQDNLFTQFAYNKLSINAGVAGENKYTSIVGIYRDQWAGLNGSPKSQMLSINFPTVYNQLGFGISMSRSSVGIQEKTDISGIYAYKINTPKTSTSVGLQMSGRNFINDFTNPNLLAIDGFDLDPAIDRIKYSDTFFNVGVGGYHKGPFYYLGVSVPRMIRANIDDDAAGTIANEVRHLYAMAGLTIPLGIDWVFYPQSLFKMAENAPYDLDVLSMFSYRDQFQCGLNFRTGGSQQSILESFDLLLGFNFNKRISASIAFDFTTTELRDYENGSFELMLRYDFNNEKEPSDVQNPRYFK